MTEERLSERVKAEMEWETRLFSPFVGKTIRQIEHGERDSYGEARIVTFHFTDGSRAVLAARYDDSQVCVEEFVGPNGERVV